MATFTLNAATVATSGTTITLTFTGASGNIVNAGNVTTGFTLTVNGVARTLAAATPSTTTLLLTVSSANKILASDVVALAYTPGIVQDSAGSPNTLAAFTSTAATNSSTQTGLSIASATVSTDGTKVTLTFTGATGNIVNTSNPTTGFTVKVGGLANLLADATPSTTTLVLDLGSQRIGRGSAVTVSYDGSGAVVDSAGTPNRLQVQTNVAVTNTSNYVGTSRALVLSTPKIYYSVDGTNFYEIGDNTPFSTTSYTGTTAATGQTSLPDASASDTIEYLYNRKATAAIGQPTRFKITRSGTTPVTLKFTCADPDVDLYYTFNGRTPHANPAQNRTAQEITTGLGHGVTGGSRSRSGGRYDDTNRPILYQNTTGQKTTIKVRAFKKHPDATIEKLASNDSIMSKIIRADVTIKGGTYNNIA